MSIFKLWNLNTKKASDSPPSFEDKPVAKQTGTTVFDGDEPEVPTYQFDQIAKEPFSQEIATILLEPINSNDIEIKPGIFLLSQKKKN